MKGLVFVSLALAACLSVHVTTAQETKTVTYFWTGNELMEALRAHERAGSADPTIEDYLDGSLCMGYVMGVSDAFYDQIEIEKTSSIAAGQVCAIVAKYLKEHPEKWHEPAADLIYWALVEAFPKEE